MLGRKCAHHRLEQAVVVAVGVGVISGLRCALSYAGAVCSWVSCGESGGEVVEGPCERCTRVSDGDGDECHPSQVFLEGRYL